MVALSPTKYLPGTLDKIEVMRRRASMNLPLFHPEDACLSRDLPSQRVVIQKVKGRYLVGKIEIHRVRS